MENIKRSLDLQALVDLDFFIGGEEATSSGSRALFSLFAPGMLI